MKKRILVTGVAGFIGSNLAKRLLDEGYSVTGIDNLSAGTLENIDSGVDFEQVDIRDAAISDLFEDVEAVFHLAAKNCLPECLKHPVEAASVNVVGTANVLEAARTGGVQKFVYADTSAEYEGIAEFPTKEDTVKPLGVYASCKHGGAVLSDSYRYLYGMNITTLRYFNVYGPAQDWRRVVPPVMSSFIIKMLHGDRPTIYGTGEKRRDFIYVDDINDFHLLSLRDERTSGRTFNMGSGVNFSVNEIYNLVEEQLKTDLTPRYKPDLPGEAEITLADITAARTLGWSPHVDIREGLRRSIRYIRENVLAARQSGNVPESSVVAAPEI
jgi:UDP-glucose 4-epimerase